MPNYTFILIAFYFSSIINTTIIGCHVLFNICCRYMIYSFQCANAESEQGIFEQVLKGQLDFSSDPWPAITDDAKDLIRKMLVREPKKRLTAHEVLCQFFFT